MQNKTYYFDKRKKEIYKSIIKYLKEEPGISFEKLAAKVAYKKGLTEETVEKYIETLLHAEVIGNKKAD